MIYAHISKGYLGIKNNLATLNSKFYAELFSAPHNIESNILFPQRIPKKDFFIELKTLETNEFSHQFDSFCENLVAQAFGQKNNKGVRLINYINLLLRYGLFDKINEFNATLDIEEEIDLELSYLKQNALIETCLNTESVITLKDELKKYADIVSYNTNFSNKLRILIINRLIVCTCRYPNDFEDKSIILKYSDILINIIESLETSFELMFLTAYAYRGIAMVEEYSKDFRSQCLNKMENILRELKASSILEEIVLKEGFYTSLQTLSKWNLAYGKENKAVENIEEMISIDPVDSTAYSELGLFYLKKKLYKNAELYFKKASELGSPAVGMNTYFYAKCLEAQGHDEKAILELYKTIFIDNEAISPCLDILNFYKKTNDISGIKILVKHITSNNVLREQLDVYEYSDIINALV